MFFALLAVTFVISVVMSFIVAAIFAKPIRVMLQRIIQDEISQAWERYLRFAIYVVGISSGVRVWDLEKYITPPAREGAKIIELTPERWVLESYRSIIGALQGTVMLLLAFFIFALIAFVIVRAFEIRKGKTAGT
jgi:sensor histidine kinase regulating citrate/malate metabolism